VSTTIGSPAIPAARAVRVVTLGRAAAGARGLPKHRVAARRLDQSALCKLVRRLARAAAIPSWQQLTPHSLRHTAITLALNAWSGTPRAGLRRPSRPPHHAALRLRRDTLDRNAAYTLTAYLATS
jgi:integrase